MNKKILLLFVINIVFIYTNTIHSQTKETLAVLKFKSFGSYMSEDIYLESLCGFLTTELFNSKKFRLVERSRLKEILNEQRFQESNLSNRQIQSLGKILGVRKIIVGEVSADGFYGSVSMNNKRNITANVRILDVQTGFIDVSITCSIIDVVSNETLQKFATDIVIKIMENY